MPTKKAETALAIHRTASLAATAWQKLEAAAQKTMNGNASAPALQLFADANGITALVSDKHGARVLLQGGKVSVTVPGCGRRINDNGEGEARWHVAALACMHRGQRPWPREKRLSRWHDWLIDAVGTCGVKVK